MQGNGAQAQHTAEPGSLRRVIAAAKAFTRNRSAGMCPIQKRENPMTQNKGGQRMAIAAILAAMLVAAMIVGTMGFLLGNTPF